MSIVVAGWFKVQFVAMHKQNLVNPRIYKVFILFNLSLFSVIGVHEANAHVYHLAS